jgi:hypothetical protein
MTLGRLEKKMRSLSKAPLVAVNLSIRGSEGQACPRGQTKENQVVRTSVDIPMGGKQLGKLSKGLIVIRPRILHKLKTKA